MPVTPRTRRRPRRRRTASSAAGDLRPPSFALLLLLVLFGVARPFSPVRSPRPVGTTKHGAKIATAPSSSSSSSSSSTALRSGGGSWSDGVSRSPLAWTTWDVALNVGREEGTWMPSEWGASGDRLQLRLQVQFRTVPFYARLDDREDFFGGPDEETRMCHVVGGGARALSGLGLDAEFSNGRGGAVRVGNGGWRVARGEGRGGTDVLRFFVELEEQIGRGDIYCPAGRVYCDCGYFDLRGGRRGRKGDVQQELDLLGDRYVSLLDEMNKVDLISFGRIYLWMDMLQCQFLIDRANKEMSDLQMIEPDTSTLRLSQDGEIGLTRNGGVSCKIEKGLAGLGSEYHILGRIEMKYVAEAKMMDSRR